MRIYSNGKPFISVDGYEKQEFISLTLLLSLPGGKGGFGSLLRAIGAQIEKTTNREACRDLSGRRLRDINAEKRFQEWMQKRERQKMREKTRKEKLEKLKEEPKVMFQDAEYFKEKDKIPAAIEEALKCGLNKINNETESDVIKTGKRNSSSPDSIPPKKFKPDMWLDVDLTGSDSDDEDDEGSESTESEYTKSKEDSLDAFFASLDPSSCRSGESEHDCEGAPQFDWSDIAIARQALQAGLKESSTNSSFSSSSDSSSDSSRSDEAPVKFPENLINHSDKSQDV